MHKPTTLRAAVTTAVQVWQAEILSGSLAISTAQGYAKHLSAFCGFAEAHGTYLVKAVDQRLCRNWFQAPMSAASPGSRSRASRRASVSTRRGRKTALRRAVNLWIELGLLGTDPVPPEVIAVDGAVKLCPLTPPEVAQLRSAGRVGIRDTLRPAIAEAALAGAAQQSIARLVVASFDAKVGALRVPGTRQTRERLLVLGPHGVEAISARVTELALTTIPRCVVIDPLTTPLFIRHTSNSCAAPNHTQLVASNLSRALTAAGVSRPGVTAGSLQQFAANSCYATTNSVEDVAELLGLHSLDRAMAKIDRKWQAEWAEQFRARGERRQP